jgi:pentose-5-phosphate-3-epimerase
MHTACFWNKFPQVRKKIERLQSQIIVKVLGAIKQKDLNRIAKVGYGYLFLGRRTLVLLM